MTGSCSNYTKLKVESAEARGIKTGEGPGPIIGLISFFLFRLHFQVNHHGDLEVVIRIPILVS